MVITSIIGIFAYGANIALAKANGIQFSTVWLVISFFDILSSYVPSPLPIYFNLNYSFSLARLRCKGIVGTQVEKTVVGSNTKIMCFDKTGTITEDVVHIKKIIPIHGKEIHSEI
jgi:P-type E1-E2 ATPase